MHEACLDEGLFDEPEFLFHEVKCLVDLPGGARLLLGAVVGLVTDLLDHVEQVLKRVATWGGVNWINGLRVDWLWVDWLRIDWLRVDWLRIDWLRIDWLRIDWLRVNWLRVNWLRVNWLRVRTWDRVLRRPNILAVRLIHEVKLLADALLIAVPDHRTVVRWPVHRLTEVRAPVPRKEELLVAAAIPRKVGPHARTTQILALLHAQIGQQLHKHVTASRGIICDNMVPAAELACNEYGRTETGLLSRSDIG